MVALIVLAAGMEARPRTKKGQRNAPRTAVAKTKARPRAAVARSRRTAKPVPVRRSYTPGWEARLSPPASPATHPVSYRLPDAEGSSLEFAGALVPFFEQLYRQQQEGGVVRVLHYGDSHTASDDWAHTMRLALQEQFGDGGPGFAMAGRPYRGYRRFDVRGDSSDGWYTDGLATRTGDGFYGLGGISLTAAHGGEWVSLSNESDTGELFFLRQPGGGSFQVSLESGASFAVSTNGATGPGYVVLPDSAAGRVTVRTAGDGPVRLFGWTLENRRGVTWETLGINGATASMFANWNENLLAAHLGRRAPALVVLAYGTNEALRPDFTSEGYAAQFREALNRIRQAVPTASILVVGPPDCEYRVRGGGWRTYPHLEEVRHIQRRAAVEQGAAFFDWREQMGGPGGVRHWVQSGLAQPDHVHLTRSGYQMLGSLLSRELLQQYRTYIELRSRTEE